MRKALWASLFVVMLLSALPIYAQSPNYDVGPVWRVTYFHIKPGQSEAFWKDIRENFKPVYADFKKEGLITDYKMWLNDTTDHPGDWDVAVGILFPNYAALGAVDAKRATLLAPPRRFSWQSVRGLMSPQIGKVEASTNFGVFR